MIRRAHVITTIIDLSSPTKKLMRDKSIKQIGGCGGRVRGKRGDMGAVVNI